MKTAVAGKERLYYFFSAYALQTGCSDQAKDEFWSLLDKKAAEVPQKMSSSSLVTLTGTSARRKTGTDDMVDSAMGRVTQMVSEFLSMRNRIISPF
ncbi:unnamed protein product [Heligmosomoides polygyrus]|uniref:Lipoprotein n=1 Tax=Heligmosomoides polygyrus TaxID=6339 RepID=A0A183G8H4_HELPZ|nr:unnamed protein product [Heligmosomoides polygyrus]